MQPQTTGPPATDRPRALAAMLLGLATLACAAPDPAPRRPLPLRHAPELTQAGELAPPDRWWTAFGDPDLDLRVEAALEGSPTLEAAWQRVRAAEALARETGAGRAVSLDGRASVELRDGSDVDQRGQVSLGLEASYEVDLWGRLDALVEADRLRAEATAADHRTAAITLSAEVALAWFDLAEARAQLALVRDQVETNATVLEVLELRFRAGQGDSADVLRQRQLIEATRAEALDARLGVELATHRLAVLEGRPPQQPGEQLEAAVARLPRLAAPPATGLPAELVRRRPDLRAALLRLEAADADVAAAAADRWPRLDLTAGLSTTALNPGRLFEDWLASLAADLVAPLVDGGAREAAIEGGVALRRQRLAEYGAVVLVAFQEVEDALAREAIQGQRLTSLRARLELAAGTTVQLRRRYLNGAADFLDVLDALRAEQALERDLLAAELEAVQLRVALHRALAGGFATPREALAEAASDPLEDSHGRTP